MRHFFIRHIWLLHHNVIQYLLNAFNTRIDRYKKKTVGKTEARKTSSVPYTTKKGEEKK